MAAHPSDTLNNPAEFSRTGKSVLTGRDWSREDKCAGKYNGSELSPKVKFEAPLSSTMYCWNCIGKERGLLRFHTDTSFFLGGLCQQLAIFKFPLIFK